MLISVTAAAVAPTAASASGFGAPIVVSGQDDARDPQVAVAPNGRTAVLYSTEIRRRHRWIDTYSVAIGPSPTQLGPATRLNAASRATWDAPPQLMARPDGGFVVCVPNGRRTKVAVVGCTIAQPGGGFGPLQIVAQARRTASLHIAGAVRPDSSTLVLTTQTLRTAKSKPAQYRTSISTFGADGILHGGTSLDRTADELPLNSSPFTPTVTPDGTAAVPAAITVDKNRQLPAVRLMPPGATQFGPPTAISSERLSDNLVLDGRAGLVATYWTQDRNGDGELRLTRLQGGTWTPPLGQPRSQTDATWWTPTSLTGASPLAIGSATRTDPDDSDCFNQVFGEVSVAALTPVGGILKGTPTRLSTPEQIADYPKIDALADGTVIANWQYAAGDASSSRVAVAIRPAGAPSFDAPQVFQLSGFFGWPTLLATGGNTAAIVWEGPWRDVTHRVMISALRDAPPYATQGTLPRHPAAPCDE